MFDIPMNTKGAMDASSLLNLNGGNNGNAGMTPQPQMGQPQVGQQAPMNQGYGQPQMDQSYNQTQMGQPMGQPMGQQPQMAQPQQAPMGQPINPRPRPAGNGVHLKKGQKFALTDPNGGQLNNIKVGLGWDILNQQCDLDASAFMLDANNKVIGDDWFVFYGQTSSPDGSIMHSGDSNGAGAGDDEVITVNLNQVNPQVQKIAFVITINEALERGLNFSMVSNAYVRVVNAVGEAEIAKFQLTDYYSNVTAMVVGELYRHNGAWKFNPVGDGVAADLYGLCARYGVNVVD